jgi:hypothetical protein
MNPIEAPSMGRGPAAVDAARRPPRMIGAPQGRSVPAARLLMVALALIAGACQSSGPAAVNIVSSPRSGPVHAGPAWYARMPAIAGCQLGYGYSGVFLDQELQEDVLLADAAMNMAKQEWVQIKTGRAKVQEGGLSQTAAYVLEKGWEERAAGLEENLKIISQFQIENSVIALCAVCRDPSQTDSLADLLDSRTVLLTTQTLPTWVQNPITQKGYLYAVGEASGYTSPVKAWQEAERQARANLAFQLAASHHVMDRSVSDNVSTWTDNMAESSAETVVSNIQIIEHTHCLTSASYYVLVRMPLNHP